MASLQIRHIKKRSRQFKTVKRPTTFFSNTLLSIGVWRDNFWCQEHFFTPALIARRKPLASSARRAGWEGSNILLRKIPKEAIVDMVTSGLPRNASGVRNEWAKFRFLQTDKRALGGWGAAVLAYVREIVEQTKRPIFTLDELYIYSTGVLAAQ